MRTARTTVHRRTPIGAGFFVVFILHPDRHAVIGIADSFRTRATAHG